jgi:hypothetical protein
VRVETTLAGAASDPGLRPALRQGRLEHELAARGFDVFAGEKLPPRRPAATPGPSAPTARPPAGTAPSGASPAQKQERDRDEARLAAAREAVAQAEARATQQREQVASARKRVEELTGMLRDAWRREAEAAREEKRTADALRAARKSLRVAERKRRPQHRPGRKARASRGEFSLETTLLRLRWARDALVPTAPEAGGVGARPSLSRSRELREPSGGGTSFA